MTLFRAEAPVPGTKKNASITPMSMNNLFIFVLLSTCLTPLNEENMVPGSSRPSAFVRSSSYLLSFGAQKNRNALGQDHPKATFKARFGSPAVIVF
jgi:hypothetical protein